MYISPEEYPEDNNVLCEADYTVVCLNFNDMYPNVINDVFSHKILKREIIADALNKCTALYKKIKQHTSMPILWFEFEDFCYQFDGIFGTVPILEGIVDRINITLCRLFQGEDTYLNLKYLIAKNGIHNSFENRGKYRWNAPYSKKLIDSMIEEIYKQHLIHIGYTKKCLVLDCDNVLWGGVLLEDGIEGILLGAGGWGRSFWDFQQFLLTMYYHGVILAICSKNDLSDVIRVFREHNEMILREEHIACFQVNWDSKVDNIKKIANILNIGLDSMVFIDDSDFEIQTVTHLLPEVKTIKYERDTVYEQLSCFHLKSHINTEQVEQRQNTYKTNQCRRSLQDEHKSLEGYLNALETKIDIHQVMPVEYSRIAELTQRTNKCTNGNRYTVAELKERVNEENYHLYSVSVSDKFSNLGLVGAFGIDGENLDLFSLSCRALGRNIETQMLEHVLTHTVQNFKFVSTGKNDGLKSMLKEILRELP